MDKVVNWLYDEASKYAITMFHKDDFDVEAMINDLLKAVEEEAVEEEDEEV